MSGGRRAPSCRSRRTSRRPVGHSSPRPIPSTAGSQPACTPALTQGSHTARVQLVIGPRYTLMINERSCDGSTASEVGSSDSSGDALAGSSVGGASRAGQRFWAAIARGVPSEDAAREPECLSLVGVRWFREGGGMPTVTQAPLSGRYLSFAEREEIAILRARGCGVRGIARAFGRSSSTISRELRRNAATAQRRS